MQFNSYELIFLFVPLTLGGFFLLGGRRQSALAIVWLVAASFFFYNWGSPVYLGLLGVSILVNYLLGTLLSGSFSLAFNLRWVLVLGIAFNLVLLGYFKYADFAIASANNLLGTDWNPPAILLPLGISFFTFGQISYLVDTYRGKAQEESFLNYCLFVSFFPKLIAGPITYYRELMPQFSKAETYQFQLENLAVGLTIFSLGLFKKVIFADSLSTYSTTVFTMAGEGQSLPIEVAWLGALAFSLQLYFDFSGYTDMAIGSARLFGIQLPLNFNSPYKANKITQLWNAWHMSLTRFFRDYFYFPLSRWLRRFAFLRTPLGQQVATYGNTLAIMLAIGLWHGASWNYVLWGGLNGLYLIVYQLWRQLRRRLGQDLTRQSDWGKFCGWLLTFSAWTVALVLPKTANLTQAWTVWQGMFGFSVAINNRAGNFLTNNAQLNFIAACLWVVISLAIVLFTPNTQQWLERYRPALDYFSWEMPQNWYQRFWQRLRWQPTQGWAAISAILTVIAVLFVAREKAFIYFQF